METGGDTFMELTQIQYFNAAAHTGHFTRAAELLFVTESTLSRNINQIEAELGIKLFDRNGKRITLNQNGEIAMQYTDEIIRNYEEMLRELKDRQHTVSGNITFAMTFPDDEPSPYIDCIQVFMKEYPLVNIRKFSYGEQQVISELNYGRIDFAISQFPFSFGSIGWSPLFSDHLGVFLSKCHPFAQAKALSVNALQSEPFVIHNAANSDHEITTSLCRKHGFSPHIMYEGSGLALIIDMIRTNRAIHVCPSTRWQEILRKFPNLHDCTCFIPLEHETITCGIAYKEDRYRSKTVSLFLDALYAKFQTLI